MARRYGVRGEVTYQMVPRRRLELQYPCGYTPLKRARLPISPPGHSTGKRTRARRVYQKRVPTEGRNQAFFMRQSSHEDTIGRELPQELPMGSYCLAHSF